MKIKEIKPIESWNLLKENENSLLIDVRTMSEFKFNGIADLSKINKSTILIAWKDYPEMQIDPQFNEKLTRIVREKFPNQDNDKIHLLFMCSGGIRSLDAAKSMSKLNYQCYNITTGFEANLDENGNKCGWKGDNLPWRQN